MSATPNHVETGDAVTTALPATDSPNPPPSPPPAGRPRRRWLRRLLWALAGLLVLLASALSALWVWAGRDGSLATALAWVSRYQPLLGTSERNRRRDGWQAALRQVLA